MIVSLSSLSLFHLLYFIGSKYHHMPSNLSRTRYHCKSPQKNCHRQFRFEDHPRQSSGSIEIVRVGSLQGHSVSTAISSTAPPLYNKLWDEEEKGKGKGMGKGEGKGVGGLEGEGKGDGLDEWERERENDKTKREKHRKRRRRKRRRSRGEAWVVVVAQAEAGETLKKKKGSWER